MTIDITCCEKVNIIDSCATWNILSSILLYNTINDNKFYFSITKFVEYECLFRERKNPTLGDIEIQKRLRRAQQKGDFQSHIVSIDDLQDASIIQNSQNLGRGELSSIAFCKKTNQVFLTDDQKARKIATVILGREKVQTVPHLVGWLFYEGLLTDGDLELVISEHKEKVRPLEKYFRQVYLFALSIRCQNKI